MTLSDFFLIAPRYDGAGVISPPIDCGLGLAVDEGAAADHPQRSFMTIVDSAPAGDVRLWFEKADAGLDHGFRREDDCGIYREYPIQGKVLYAYYIFAEERLRLILDNGTVTLSEFEENDPPSLRGDTELMQYSLVYEKMIRGTSCDCGMLYALRLGSGELFLIDGGEEEQATDEAVVEVMTRLRELTGSERITVAAWFCTHAHNDHMDLFAKLLRVYGDHIDLKRVVFNFPSAEKIVFAPCVVRLKERLAKYAPDAVLLRPHTGEVFDLGGVEFTVMLTHEDIADPYAEKLYPGMNETSTVLRIDFSGCSLVLLADIPEINGDLLVSRCAAEGANGLSCTFLQAAHHCINRIENVYRAADTRIVLIPEGRKVVNLEHFALICRSIPDAELRLAGDGTTVYTCREGEITDVRSFPVVGGIYDGSEI